MLVRFGGYVMIWFVLFVMVIDNRGFVWNSGVWALHGLKIG